MHIPDGFVSPAINLATGVVSTGAVGLSVARANRRLETLQVPLLGVTAAFIFAAQMINFPVAAGTSGHFMGALLAALLLGPGPGLIVMVVVLVLQAFLFADGGVTALGTNVFNMGLIAGWLGYGLFRVLNALMPSTRSSYLVAVGVSAWASVLLASVAASFELALSGTVPLKFVLPAMAGVHTLIGVGEGLITVAALSMVISARPDMVTSYRLAVQLSHTSEESV